MVRRSIHYLLVHLSDLYLMKSISADGKHALLSILQDIIVVVFTVIVPVLTMANCKHILYY